MSSTTHGAYDFIREGRSANSTKTTSEASGYRWVRTVEQYAEQIGYILQGAESNLSRHGVLYKDRWARCYEREGQFYKAQPPAILYGGGRQQFRSLVNEQGAAVK